MSFPPALRFALVSGVSGAAALLAAGCGSSGSSTGAPASSATPASAAASASASAEAPPTARPSAPVDAVPPPSSAPLADAAPPPEHPAAPAASSATPGKPPPAHAATAGAGAPDAGAASAAGADAGTPDAGAVSPGQQVARQLDAIFAGKKTFSAHFDQQHTLKFNDKVEDSSGTVLMERPGKISFRYDPPSMNRIVSDGVTMKVYIANDKTMYERPMANTPYPGVLSFMMGGGISGSFTFTVKPAPSFAGTVLEGKPLVAEPSYETVLFYVKSAELAKGDPGAMERVLLVDATGNKNRFTFSRVTQPPSIAPVEFTFTPPPGTTIQR